MQIRREWTMGAYRAHFEEPDLLVVECGGDCTLAEAKALTELYRETGLKRPIFLIVHVGKYVLTPEARSYMTKELRSEWFRGIVFVGASTMQRSMGKVLLVALAFLGKWAVEGHFAPTEEAARALIQKMREKA